MKVFVVDDEEPARRRLTRMLTRIAGVEVSAQLETGSELMAALEQQWPDAVFLDVQLPGADGISIAKAQLALPPIVFVTAYGQYAVDAFSVHAVDYLVKPVRAERLAETVKRLQLRQMTSCETLARANASASVSPASTTARVVSTRRGVIRLFDAREITRFWAHEKYTLFWFEGSEYMTEESLGTLEERLSELGFTRIHRAELVRLEAVRALRMEDGICQVELSDGQQARVSRRCLGLLKRALGLA